MKKIFAIGLSLLFIIIGIALIFNSNGLKNRCTEVAQGTVIEIEREWSTDSDNHTTYTYYPVIEYSTKTKTITKKSPVGSNPSKYNVNDRVEVHYNPDKLEEFYIEGDSTANFISIMFIVIGGIALIISIRQAAIGKI